MSSEENERRMSFNILDAPPVSSEFEMWLMGKLYELSALLGQMDRERLELLREIVSFEDRIVSEKSEEENREIRYKEAINSFMLPNNKINK